MVALDDTVQWVGPLAEHPRAEQFVQEVRRVHHRYAEEVVAHFSLCPFMGDPRTAFGRFIVVLDTELDLALACREVVGSAVNKGQLAHLIYPLVQGTSRSFERFASELHQAVRKRVFEQGGHSPPVHATFHPQMAGDESSASKLVGLLRHAPDPFIQFVPEGLQQGGSTFLDPSKIDLASLVAEMKQKPQTTFERLVPARLVDLRQRLEAIRADRDRSYGTFLQALL